MKILKIMPVLQGKCPIFKAGLSAFEWGIGSGRVLITPVFPGVSSEFR